MRSLDQRLCAAHAKNDISTLVALYCEAATAAETTTQKGFYLTHAYVYALEAAHPDALRLHAQLCSLGKEL